MCQPQARHFISAISFDLTTALTVRLCRPHFREGEASFRQVTQQYQVHPGRVAMEKPLSIKHTLTARAVFPGGKTFRHGPTEHCAGPPIRVRGQRPCPAPQGRSPWPVNFGPWLPPLPLIPSFPSREMRAKASLSATGRMLCGKIPLPQNRQKPQSLWGFQASRAFSHYCLLSPRTKNWVCFLSATLNYIPQPFPT